MIRLAVVTALCVLVIAGLFAAKLTAMWRREEEETDARARRAGV